MKDGQEYDVVASYQWATVDERGLLVALPARWPDERPKQYDSEDEALADLPMYADAFLIKRIFKRPA